MKISLFIILLGFFGIFEQSQAQPIELIFWHSMAGSLGREVKLIANDFNQSQTKFFIKPVYKGDYIETLTSFAAAFRAHRPPAIIQIFEVGTALMLSPPGIIKPVHDLMPAERFADFIPSVREFYSQNDKLMAMPFNLSVPVIYYNKNVLRSLGYTNFPQTWDEMELLVSKIKQAGYECSYTTAYPGWILIESFLAVHGLNMLTEAPLRAAYNSPELLSHFKRLKRWQKLSYFKYGGRVNDATVLFTGNICPLFSQSSGAYNSLKSLVNFELGVAAVPLDTKITKKRQANITGGAALWAISGQTEEQYQGIAQFFLFLALPEIQKRWHEHTGYLPIGLQGIYRKIPESSTHPVLEIAKNDLKSSEFASRRKNLGPQNQIRSINDEVLEAMFAGLIPAGKALEEAVARANHIIWRFARNTG